MNLTPSIDIVCLYGVQLSVILLLALFTREISKRDTVPYAKFFVVGWWLNFVSVTSLIIDYFSPESFLGNLISKDYMDALSVLMSCFFALFGIHLFSPPNKEIEKYIRYIYYFSVFVIFILAYYYNHYVDNFISTLFIDLLHISSLVLLTAYYLKQSNKSKIIMILIFLGGFGYSLTQMLNLIDNPDNIEHHKNIIRIGWWVSSLTKTFILFGLYMIIQDKIKKSVKASIYENILSLTLHETTSLLNNSQSEIDNIIIPQIDRQNKDFEFDRGYITQKLKSTSFLIKRVASIEDASDKLYKAAKNKVNFLNMSIDELMEDENRNQLKGEPVSVNSIIELSYLWRKRTLNHGVYKLKAEFGANCHVVFKKSALFQIINNILKNSEEASSQRINGVMLVYVKTKVIKKKSMDVNTDHIDFIKSNEEVSFVRIEIEDDGVGTNFDLSEISKFGFSEKASDDNNNEGIGMFLIQKQIRDNGGFVYFESPPLKSLIPIQKKENQGSKIILYIRRPK